MSLPPQGEPEQQPAPDARLEWPDATAPSTDAWPSATPGAPVPDAAGPGWAGAAAADSGWPSNDAGWAGQNAAASDGWPSADPSVPPAGQGYEQGASAGWAAQGADAGWTSQPAAGDWAANTKPGNTWAAAEEAAQAAQAAQAQQWPSATPNAGQYPGQYPGQFGEQYPGQYAGQPYAAGAQYPAQYPGQYGQPYAGYQQPGQPMQPGYGSPYPPMYGMAGMVQKPKRGLSIAGMVLSLCSIFFWWTFVVPVLGLVLSCIGLAKEPAGKGMAIAGICVSGVVMLLWLIAFIAGAGSAIPTQN